MHELSLEQTEYLPPDRWSWMRFCGLGTGDPAPDANTPCDFREALIAAGALERLFARLDRAMPEADCLPTVGQIVDATLVPASAVSGRSQSGSFVEKAWAAAISSNAPPVR